MKRSNKIIVGKILLTIRQLQCFISYARKYYQSRVRVVEFLLKYRDFIIISSDEKFNLDYYNKTSGIHFDSREEAVIHYIIIGEHVNLDPCLGFSRFRYLCHNPDLHQMKMMPFSHFILYADQENRHY